MQAWIVHGDFFVDQCDHHNNHIVDDIQKTGVAEIAKG